MAAASSSSSSRRTANLSFLDLDDKDTFDQAERYATHIKCKNFVVEFGPEHARIAYDFDDAQIEELLNARRDEAQYPVRWINIWTANDHHNKALTGRIGEHYGLSRRLTSLMTRSRKKPATTQPKGKDTIVSVSRKSNDIEQAIPSPAKSIRLNSLSPNGNLAKSPSSATASLGNDGQDFVMNMRTTVNYSDIDLTPKALCIGAHWLHRRPDYGEQMADVQADKNSIIPPRHFCWLAVTCDNTVISIHDEPNCEAPKSNEALQVEEIKNMRLNTSTVLIQISKHGFNRFDDQPLSQAGVRQYLQDMSHPREQGEASEEHVDLAAEGTSNLFYYLFEDYVAAMPLSISGRKLMDITPKILNSATRKSRTKASEIIPALHYLTKDLRELKHLFEGYRYIISKIMITSDKNLESIQRRNIGRLSRMNTTMSDISNETEHQRVMPVRNRKVFLADSAINRFDRLADRLRWLMINTIDGYLDEIQALSTTYFNLTQQKDSSATARLTRSATLLAKLSVFFLPISFITGYFSIQIEDLYKWWDGNTYWYTFAVVATISFLSLFFFSRLLMFFSDVLDEWAEKILGLIRTLAEKVPILKYKRNVEDDDDD
ncbi:hypothetical protein PG995_002173 [Apiospora arundinis]